MINPEWFIGEVVNFTDDPEKLGRVRIKLFQQHDSVLDNNEFIWSHVMMPTTSESLAGIGQTPSFELGTRVIGFYADGASKRVSVITGTLLFNPLEDIGAQEHSLSFNARGTNAIEKKKLGIEEPDSAFAAQYPYNKVTTTKSGHVIEIDDTPGKERIHVYHKAGAYLEIDQTGRITCSTPVDSFEIVGGSKSIEIKGDARISVQGSCDATILGDARVSSAGNLYLGALGNLELSAGGSLTISSSAGVAIRSPAGIVTTGPISTLGIISSASGATGSFTSPSGRIISVSKGIVTSIE